jgi:hypothetical protein
VPPKDHCLRETEFILGGAIGPPESDFEFKLVDCFHCFHRFYATKAAGYSQLPIVIVRELVKNSPPCAAS